MSTFIYVLGFLMFCVGTAIVANTLKFPLGPLGVLLIVVGAFISIKKMKKFYKKLDEKGRKGLC